MQRDITGQDRANKELSAFDDELREASSEFAQSLRKLELAEQQLVEQERFSALGEMTAGVVHDISNALTPVVGLVQLLHSFEDLPLAAENCVSQLQSSTHHALQVLTNLKNYYRNIDASKVRSRCNLRSIVEWVPDLTKSKWWSLRQTHPA